MGFIVQLSCNQMALITCGATMGHGGNVIMKKQAMFNDVSEFAFIAREGTVLGEVVSWLTY